MSRLNWPADIERTDPSDRRRGSKFSASLGDTNDDIQTAMERMNVTDWRASHNGRSQGTNNLPRYNSNPEDPGFVIRWSKDGRDHAVACDGYTDLAANAREAYLWIEETRKRTKRKARTAAAEFAAAALPSGNENGDVTLTEPPEDILGVHPDSPEAVITTAFQERVKAAHGDSGGESDHSVKELKAAREALLE